MRTIKQIQNEYMKKINHEKKLKKLSESRQENLLKDITVPEVDKKIHNNKKKTVHFQEKTYLNKVSSTKEEKKKLNREPTEEEVERVICLEKELQKTYRNETEKQINNEVAKQKEFEPITSGLRNIERAVRQTDEDISKFLVPVNTYTSTPEFKDKQNKLITQKSITNTPTREIETQTQHSSVFLGRIATRYLPKACDSKFGIRYNTNTEKYMVGKNEINIKDNDIILNNKTYKGTQGLWRLLSYTEAVESNLYNPEDFVTYKNILLETDSIYQNNDKTTGKPKSSAGEKYKRIIAPLWKEICNNKKLQTENNVHEGSGLINYTENPIQYKYINNLNELLKRLNFIASEEVAGNNNFHNEKLAVINFVAKEMETLIDRPKGIEYLISFVSSLPRKVVKGDGIVNNFLNSKFMPEIHWPGYNYLGPFTKPKHKPPINKLDEAAMVHDIYYEKHKDTKSRHKADLILQNTARDIYKDPNTPLGERTAAVVVTNTMKLKRKLGMGLI